MLSCQVDRERVAQFLDTDFDPAGHRAAQSGLKIVHEDCSDHQRLTGIRFFKEFLSVRRS